ncbi:metallothionein [Pyxidicoccus fallax]|uniref:Metallothionein n=1 Tax=Pyxidicoccus fallax TaxID=394095 RepID=A0A848LTH0_9BACT|nr:metallothionein [Pyxidicoccus fallax]NMO20793.1 metallothionein [Pyxidicoccus fallax]NPC81770.1 metallothionein [Pyxidicoccus fallax]
MTRIATMVAAGLMAGGLLLAPGAAHACEAHARAAAEAPKADAKKAEPSTKDADKAPRADPKASQRGEVERPLDALDSLMAGKCQCGSKADCTCKKGSCDCSKCRKSHREVMETLRGRPAELKLEEARYDASAGIFI